MEQKHGHLGCGILHRHTVRAHIGSKPAADAEQPLMVHQQQIISEKPRQGLR
jgi:hypothetical protein